MFGVDFRFWGESAENKTENHWTVKLNNGKRAGRIKLKQKLSFHLSPPCWKDKERLVDIAELNHSKD